MDNLSGEAQSAEITKAEVKTRKPRKDKEMKKIKKAVPAVKAKSSNGNGAGGVCLFSGKATKGKKTSFLPGYDAKLKGLLVKIVKGEAKLNEIPALAKAALKERAVVGFRINGGGELIKSRAVTA